ncbi:MAG: metal ABC transporter solute-binding protein, Zn/Mn family [Syntrophobacteraceae bacterium]
MKNLNGKLLLSSLIFALSCCAFYPLASAQAAAPMPVTVSILPQKYFVEKIGGKLVDIEVMVTPGATPEQYEPKPRQMSDLARSRIYFACGVPFEATWLPRIASANPKMLVAHTDRGIEKRSMEAHQHHEHATPAGVHAHEAGEVKDPHIWLSPPLVMLQARSIFEALAANDPQNRQSYESNYKNFIAELAELDTFISRLFGSRGAGGHFMVFHPAWGYFADAYGLEQTPVEVEGKEPKARDLDRFIKMARELKIKTIFVQPQYSPKTAQTIADAVGAKLVHADDLAPEWEKNLRQVAEQIAAALAGR